MGIEFVIARSGGDEATEAEGRQLDIQLDSAAAAGLDRHDPFSWPAERTSR
jgi:hypothetical protein